MASREASLVRIRAGSAGDVEACVDVLASLPDYFTISARDEVRKVIDGNLVLVAEVDGRVVGFAVAEQRYPKSAEILFAAVRRAERHSGIGSALIVAILASLVKTGVELVEVKTLDSSSGYEPYIATRAFWEHHGFVQIDCIDPLPGWDSGNPSAIYAKAIARPQSAARDQLEHG